MKGKRKQIKFTHYTLIRGTPHFTRVLFFIHFLSLYAYNKLSTFFYINVDLI